jgi:hypothetical protein
MVGLKKPSEMNIIELRQRKEKIPGEKVALDWEEILVDEEIAKHEAGSRPDAVKEEVVVEDVVEEERVEVEDWVDSEELEEEEEKEERALPKRAPHEELEEEEEHKQEEEQPGPTKATSAGVVISDVDVSEDEVMDVSGCQTKLEWEWNKQCDDEAHHHAAGWMKDTEDGGDGSVIPKKFTPCRFFFKAFNGCRKEEGCEFSHNRRIFGEEPFADFLKNLSWERKDWRNFAQPPTWPETERKKPRWDAERKTLSWE